MNLLLYWVWNFSFHNYFEQVISDFHKNSTTNGIMSKSCKSWD